MIKVISYSIFNDCHPAELNFYLRGAYWNLRMNKLIYPSFVTHLMVSDEIMGAYFEYIDALVRVFDNIHGHTIEKSLIKPRCEKMLWRLLPLWQNADVVLCRDADSITTYKEAQFVNYWLAKSKAMACGINDNPAHTGTKLMGGLCGFRKGAFKESNFNEFINGYDLSKHGSDQKLLNMKYQGEIFMNDGFIGDRASPLWESNLIPAFMGSAGFNELECLRFFRRHDKNNYDEFEKQFPNIFFWWL